MRYLVWIVRGLIFAVLFAFALANQEEARIRWFFGNEWRAPMVFIVLAAFAIGAAFGIVAMVPSWWKHRRIARRETAARTAAQTPTPAATSPSPVESPMLVVHPPRDGL